MSRAREKLVDLVKEWDVSLRHSSVRVDKTIQIQQGCYRHAKQHKRARREMCRIKTL